MRNFNGKYLTTTAMSVIEASKSTQFEEKAIESKQKKEVKFPPLSIDQIEEFYFCAKCNHKTIPNAKLLKCINCGAKSNCHLKLMILVFH